MGDLKQKASEAVVRYEKALWLRAVVQVVPGGGSVDVLLAGKAAEINQRRLDELLSRVTSHLETVEECNRAFLESEEFFEVLRRSAEVAAHSASPEKRQIVANFLSGRILDGKLSDLSSQVLEDLRAMQPIHFEVLAALPHAPNQSVDKRILPDAIKEMPLVAYEKAMSDLERFGFIRYNIETIGAIGAGGGIWRTTEYISIFKAHIRDFANA